MRRKAKTPEQIAAVVKDWQSARLKLVEAERLKQKEKKRNGK